MKTQASKKDVASTNMLNARLAANSQSSRDFDEWCLRQFPELPMPSKVLDLGCGTGKQTLLFSPLLSPKSEIWGIDIATESLKVLEANYRSKAKLQVLEGSFDEIGSDERFQASSFDLIYASYALYYTKNLKALIPQIYRLLKDGGIFWLVAPYMETNSEFLSIIRQYHEVEPFMDYVFDEFHGEVIAHAEEAGFKSLKPSLFRNKVSFSNGEAFMKYLSNSLFYRPGHDEEIIRDVNAVVREEGSFRVSKNVISIQIRK